ncbi:hypothetical protein F2P81_014544 [Scophthalmus maximus]|uniref:Uncharacterized protein n=1 Tax=Scophthalmus maximus TaxID=52904 RepID=A0A6A4SME8_SCOMX|nr:hypothetical protein F2P81_014544 [Scophthalmus maximus]
MKTPCAHRVCALTDGLTDSGEVCGTIGGFELNLAGEARVTDNTSSGTLRTWRRLASLASLNANQSVLPPKLNHGHNVTFARTRAGNSVKELTRSSFVPSVRAASSAFLAQAGSTVFFPLARRKRCFQNKSTFTFNA